MERNKTLLIIDAQVNMFDEQMPIHNADQLLATLSGLIERARQTNTAVIFVRHNGQAGDPDEPGTPGWHIHPALPVREQDPIIDKHKPDSFFETNLQSELELCGTRQLIIAGMQTEYCINATSRHAAELGYEVVLVTDAHSTFDMETMRAEQVISQYNSDWGEIASLTPAADVDFA